MSRARLERARRAFCALHDHIRDAVVAARNRSARTLARVAAVTAADTIYRIDRVSEHAILAWFEAHWPADLPVELVMEGLEDADEPTTFPRGTPVAATEWKCILDPIDGTRGLMYDKRPAFILTGLAPQRGARTHLDDIVVAAMSEIPTSKQHRCDQLSTIRGGGVRAVTHDLVTGGRRSWRPRPSRATEFDHGFASLARFFPEGKALLGEVEEALWRELGILGKDGGQRVFDDQYISTGGQLFELVAGHDRMLGDLRPLAYAQLGLSSAALCCHPYDICTALIAREAGCVIEAPDGGPLRPPLDTTTPVAWMGYANRQLASLVRPVLRRILREKLAAGR